MRNLQFGRLSPRIRFVPAACANRCIPSCLSSCVCVYVCECVSSAGHKRFPIVDKLGQDLSLTLSQVSKSNVAIKTGPWYSHSPQRTLPCPPAVLLRQSLSLHHVCRHCHISFVPLFCEGGVRWSNQGTLLGNGGELTSKSQRQPPRSSWANITAGGSAH